MLNASRLTSGFTFSVPFSFRALRSAFCVLHIPCSAFCVLHFAFRVLRSAFWPEIVKKHIFCQNLKINPMEINSPHTQL